MVQKPFGHTSHRRGLVSLKSLLEVSPKHFRGHTSMRSRVKFPTSMKNHDHFLRLLKLRASHEGGIVQRMIGHKLLVRNHPLWSNITFQCCLGLLSASMSVALTRYLLSQLYTSQHVPINCQVLAVTVKKSTSSLLCDPCNKWIQDWQALPLSTAHWVSALETASVAPEPDAQRPDEDQSNTLSKFSRHPNPKLQNNLFIFKCFKSVRMRSTRPCP